MSSCSACTNGFTIDDGGTERPCVVCRPVVPGDNLGRSGIRRGFNPMTRTGQPKDPNPPRKK